MSGISFAGKLDQTKATLPHFDLPFRLRPAGVVVVEQDSLEDVVNCVEAALRTERGTRKEIPTFGTREFTFQTQPLDMRQSGAQILEHEPRAELFSEQHPNIFDEMIAEVAIRVSSGVETELEEAELEAVNNF